MASMTSWQHTSTNDAATELAEHLGQGFGLPIVETSLLLDDDEEAHATVRADCWWYGEIDVLDHPHQFIAFGGLGLFALTTAISAIGNHRRRAAARELAAPQWRYLGHARVVLTSHRTLIALEGEWMTLWHDDLLQLAPGPQQHRLLLTLDNGALYALQGPWVPYLAVVLAHLV